MATRKVTLLQRIGASSRRALKSGRRAHATAKKTLRCNPTEEARRAVVTRWESWALDHELTPLQIKNGIYVVRTMPDPTRIKDFSALASMLGARAKNPRKPAARSQVKKTRKTAARKAKRPITENNFVVARVAGRNAWYPVAGYVTKAQALNAAKLYSEQHKKDVVIFTRKEINALAR